MGSVEGMEGQTSGPDRMDVGREHFWHRSCQAPCLGVERVLPEQSPQVGILTLCWGREDRLATSQGWSGEAGPVARKTDSSGSFCISPL